MPSFRSTYNIFKKPDEDEVFDPNWMDSNKLILPPRNDWDYKREIQIEDVDIWEVIYESGTADLYAAWCPHAEFYMLVTKNFSKQRKWGETVKPEIETFYGIDANILVQKRMKALNCSISTNMHWVEPEQMWLYPSSVQQVDILL